MVLLGGQIHANLAYSLLNYGSGCRFTATMLYHMGYHKQNDYYWFVLHLLQFIHILPFHLVRSQSNIILFSTLCNAIQGHGLVWIQNVFTWFSLICYSYTSFASQRQKCIEPYKAWWRHQMETFSALLAICAGNSPVPGEFPAQRPVTRSVDVFFDLRPNKRLSKQSWGWWFETLSCPLWRHCNGNLGNLMLVLLIGG